ncbi:MAG: hypothetical protein WDM81_06920 [Rhizomicrobium sp.]
MTDLLSLPPQPAGTPWPTQDWPTGDVPASADRARLHKLVDYAFAPVLPDDLREDACAGS